MSESVESVVYQWAVASGCGPTPHYLTLSDDVRETRYIDTRAFAAVSLITVAKAAHSWPEHRTLITSRSSVLPGVSVPPKLIGISFATLINCGNYGRATPRRRIRR